MQNGTFIVLDNITHTLFGVLVGEAACTFRREKPSPPFRNLVVAVSAVANNFPDLDILYSTALNQPLGYLLHHRGYTHTFLGCLPQAAAITFAAWLMLSVWRGHQLTLRQWVTVFFVAVFGICLHVGLDALNSYGVHPLSPFNNRWLYGDILFIIEPLVWIALIPFLHRAIPFRAARVALLALFLLAIAVCWAPSFVPWPMALAATALGAVTWVARKSFAAERAWVGAFASGILVLLIFAGTSAYVRKLSEDLHTQNFPQTQLFDVVLNPLPADPFCWNVLTIEETPSDHSLISRKAVVAPFPKLWAAEQCPLLRWGQGVAKLDRVIAATDPQIHWLGQYVQSADQLSEFKHSHCGVAAFLKFARAPFLLLSEENVLVGDLRFDVSEGLGFSKFLFPRVATFCSEDVPAWREPRRDVLSLAYSKP